MKKVLLIALGSTARADCLAEAIGKSDNVELYSYMISKNPNVIKRAKACKIGKLEDLESIKKFASEIKADFAVISPESALAYGVVDALKEIGVPSFAPSKTLARLETSKSFTRKLLNQYSIDGSPEYRIFDSLDEIQDYFIELKNFVVKPDGLTGGKGVKVFGEHLKTIEESLQYCKEILAQHARVIIEEELEGEEFSIQFISDGKTLIPTPAVQDHKRAYENDVGANTGGMGSYSSGNHLLPFLQKKDFDSALEITKKVAEALRKETGEYYIGIIYGGFMLTANGLKLLEYNSRFGDPEVMNVLPLLKNDFVEVCEKAIEGKLNSIKIEFENLATVCKYAVPEGYPLNPKKGGIIAIARAMSVLPQPGGP